MSAGSTKDGTAFATEVSGVISTGTLGART
jgi:hypothetical protein